MNEPDEGIPLRCFCKASPLLAMFGQDPKTGEPWIHVRSWKQKRLYVEIIAAAGHVKIRCRACLRWHTVKIIRGAPALQEELSEVPQQAKVS